MTTNEYCCADWLRAGEEHDQWCVPTRGYGHPAPFTGFRLVRIEEYTYSEYTGGHDLVEVGAPLRFCPWCGSDRPGNAVFYPVH